MNTTKTKAATKQTAKKKEPQRFVTKQQDDGLWYVWDKQNETFSTNSYEDRSLALKLAAMFEDHARKLQHV
ncbi:MAG TPA: hypothetical protein VHK27_12680 [Gammaproteobacteria bacterium]|nr:hypothetical protein [Gammaproteobacteria bacterium]